MEISDEGAAMSEYLTARKREAASPDTLPNTRERLRALIEALQDAYITRRTYTFLPEDVRTLETALRILTAGRLFLC